MIITQSPGMYNNEMYVVNLLNGLESSKIRTAYVCSDPFTLGSVASGLLSSFYGSTLKYRFQYTTTPLDEDSWVTITTSSLSTYTINDPSSSPIFSGVKNGKSVFFRVIAATESTLNSTSIFSQTNYCKNYSISPSVVTCLANLPVSLYVQVLICPRPLVCLISCPISLYSYIVLLPSSPICFTRRPA